MATKDQYEFFRNLYEEEERTSAQLEERSKVYLGIVSAILFATVLKANEVSSSMTKLGIPWWAMLVEALILSSCLVCVIYALRVQAFEAVNDAELIIENFPDDGSISDEEFFEDRIADYAVAATRNRVVNNRIALVLVYAGWVLLAGMLWILFSILVALWRVR